MTCFRDFNICHSARISRYQERIIKRERGKRVGAGHSHALD